MAGPWMLCVLGWGLSGHYHGWPMDALRARMGFEWTLSWLAHGCSACSDGVLIWTLSWLAHACSAGMDAVLIWTLSWLAHGCSAGIGWSLDLDIIMVGPWMLCVLGWGLSGRYHGRPMDALRARMGFEWTLLRSAHACYHGWPMYALRERMGFEWTLSWFVHGCSPK